MLGIGPKQPVATWHFGAVITLGTALNLVAGGGGIGGAGPLPCERAEVVGVDPIGHHQLQAKALAKGPRHGPLLAMAAGQQHKGA